jgi:hypothetical protein
MPAAAHEGMRNLSLETVQFTHKIKCTADKNQTCAISERTILVHFSRDAPKPGAAHRKAASASARRIHLEPGPWNPT